MPEATYPHLSKAPIAEAVVEFKVTGRPAPIEAFERFAAALGSGYPQHMTLQQASARLELSETGAHADIPVSRIGVRLASSDGKDVVIGAVRSFVVSRLAPYQSWDVLVRKIKSAWPVYCEHFAPDRIIRLGVRCINRIDLGEVSIDLDTVFTAGPKIPPDLPQGLGQFATRVIVPIDNDVGVSIAQNMEPSSRDVVLDIDSFEQLDVAPDDAALWDRLERLHKLRNDAFFASLYKHVWEKYL
jgi:uncharacterized protein (TIGR04255 family)